MAKRTGYKNPPAEHQWAPGQSGNPSGRPKKKTTAHQDIANVLFEPIHINDARGRKRRWHAFEVALMSLCKNMLKGTPSAFLSGFNIVEALLDESEEQLKQEEEWSAHDLKQLTFLGLQLVDGEIVPIEEETDHHSE